MALNTYKILIVEDDRGLNRGIALALKEETVEFLSALTLAQAKEIWKNNAVDMVLLDVNLPDGSGYELLKEIRRASQIPVLMLTANDLEIDEVTGFRLGADDYITKPFSLMVLRARVERMRFRIRQTESYGYEDERFQFFYDEMRYLADGQEIVLSKTEQKLLKLFTEHIGQTLTREQLIDTLWTGDRKYVDENALSVTVNRLRRKLEGKGRECPIQTVYGLGYVWEKRE
ncbi:MAG: response regulator transcription factor [Christensenellales bacterium]